jgi:hypothetical protein
MDNFVNLDVHEMGPSNELQEYFLFIIMFNFHFYISTILKAPVSTVVLRHVFKKNPSHLSQINLVSIYAHNLHVRLISQSCG